MTLSQEILVLDFGDEKQSDFLKSDASIDFNEAGKIVKNDASNVHQSLPSVPTGYIYTIYLQTKQ